MVCTKCRKQLEAGEIKCSRCGSYIRLGSGKRALYMILSFIAMFVVPLYSFAFGVLMADGLGEIYYEEDILWAKTVLLGMLVIIPAIFVINLIVSTAMRRENWEKRHDILMLLPVILSAVAVTVSFVTAFMGTYLGRAFILLFLGSFLIQLLMLFIARSIRNRLVEIKAIYAEYRRLKEENK